MTEKKPLTDETLTDDAILEDHPRIRLLAQFADKLFANKHFQAEPPWKQARLFCRSALAILENPPSNSPSNSPS